MSERALCAADCRPEQFGGARQAMPGFAICERCETRAWESLHWIADTWDATAEALTVPEVHDGERHGSRGASTGIALNEVSTTARAQTRETLRFWVHVILDQHPGFKGPRDHDAPAYARYVARHIKTLTRTPDDFQAVGLLSDIAQLRRLVRRAAYPSGARLFDTGMACTEHGTNDQGGRVPCPGTMQTWVTDRMETLPNLVCSVDRDHILEPHTWMRARRGLAPEVREWQRATGTTSETPTWNNAYGWD